MENNCNRKNLEAPGIPQEEPKCNAAYGYKCILSLGHLGLHKTMDSIFFEKSEEEIKLKFPTIAQALAQGLLKANQEFCCVDMRDILRDGNTILRINNNTELGIPIRDGHGLMPITFCPFCGKPLKPPEQKVEETFAVGEKIRVDGFVGTSYRIINNRQIALLNNDNNMILDGHIIHVESLNNITLAELQEIVGKDAKIEKVV